MKQNQNTITQIAIPKIKGKSKNHNGNEGDVKYHQMSKDSKAIINITINKAKLTKLNFMIFSLVYQ